MPRLGVAWDPGDGTWAIRSSYGVFYDQFQNGAGTASQVAISAIPVAQFVQFSGAGLNFQNPYAGRPPIVANSFVPPSTVFAMDVNTSRRISSTGMPARALFERYVAEVRYVGAPAGACRGTSRRTPPFSPLAPRRRTPTGDGSTRTAPRTGAPATSRPSP